MAEDNGAQFKENWGLLANEYESMIQALTSQVNCYKEEHESLKKEIATLLQENEKLSEKIKSAHTIPQSDEVRHTYSEDDFNNNLKHQISVLAKEKESAMNLWQNSLMTIDRLEEELKLHEGHIHGYISKESFTKTKQMYTKRIEALEQKLIEMQKEINVQKETYENCLERKTIETERCFQKEQTSHGTIKELESNVCKLKLELEYVIKAKTDIETRLQKSENKVDDLQREIRDSKLKVQEACQVIEAALMEKDAALIREQHAKDEIEKMAKRLTESVQEANEIVKKDIEAMKNQYSKKLKIVYQENVQLNDQAKLKGLEFDKLTHECKMLENENERMKRGNVIMDDGNTSKLLVIEKNMESTFQKLLLSEKKCLQLEAERDSIKMDIEQMANNYKRDIATREVEKKVLEKKAESLQKDLELSNTQLYQVADHVKLLNVQIQTIDVDVRKQFHLNEMEHRKQMEQLNENHVQITSELQTSLDAQLAFIKRWKSEVKEIIFQLENRLKQLKQECSQLKKQNKQLQFNVIASENRLMEYEHKIKNV